jgi:hypothetical protein
MKKVKLGKKEFYVVNKDELDCFRVVMDENTRLINHYVNMIEISDDVASKETYARMLSNTCSEMTKYVKRFLKES